MDGEYNIGYLKSFFNHNCYIALLHWIKLGLFLLSTPSSQCDIKRVCIPMHDKWALDHDGTGQDICGHADKLVDDQLPVVHTLKKLSIGMPDNHSLPILLTLSGMISHGSHSEAYRTIACSSIWMLLAQQWMDSPCWSWLLSVLVGNHGQRSMAKGAGAHAVSSLQQQLKDGKALSVQNHLSSMNSNRRCKNWCRVLTTTTAQRCQSFISLEPLELNEFQQKVQEPVQGPHYNNSSKTPKLHQFRTTWAQQIPTEGARTGAVSLLQQQLIDAKSSSVQNHFGSTNSNRRCKNQCSVLTTTTAHRHQIFISSEPLELNEFQWKVQEPVQHPHYNNSS